MKTIANLHFLPGEKFHTVPNQVSGGHIEYLYAVSNYGRLIKFLKKYSDGVVLKCSRQQGFPIWRKRQDGNNHAILVHRLVAIFFVTKKSTAQKFVIHLDHNKENNHYKNLKWASQKEVTAHNLTNPRVIKAKKLLKENPSYHNSKLTEAKVRQIKQLLTKKKTLKFIASKFGVSDMQIYRIKVGENWGNVE